MTGVTIVLALAAAAGWAGWATEIAHGRATRAAAHRRAGTAEAERDRALAHADDAQHHLDIVIAQRVAERGSNVRVLGNAR